MARRNWQNFYNFMGRNSINLCCCHFLWDATHTQPFRRQYRDNKAISRIGEYVDVFRFFKFLKHFFSSKLIHYCKNHCFVTGKHYSSMASSEPLPMQLSHNAKICLTQIPQQLHTITIKSKSVSFFLRYYGKVPRLKTAK